MAMPMMDQISIDMLNSTTVNIVNPDVRQLADVISKVIPIVSRVAEISNVHGTAMSSLDSNMKAGHNTLESAMKSSHIALDSAMKAGHTTLESAMKTGKSCSL